jgi:hypothetical protein
VQEQEETVVGNEGRGRREGWEKADRGRGMRGRGRVCEYVTFLFISVASLSHRMENKQLEIVGPLGLELGMDPKHPNCVID